MQTFKEYLMEYNDVAIDRNRYSKMSRRARNQPAEEEEAKAPANRDRDMEFQGTMDRLNKPTQKDDLESTPNNKRLKQRYNRYKRKTWGGSTFSG